VTPGSRNKGVGKIAVLNDQGVVTDSLKFLWNSLEDSCVVVFDVGDLSVYRLWSVSNSSAMGPAKALMSKTYSEDGNVRGLEDLSTDSKILDIATWK
jgi:hypothetical protein